MSYSMKNSHNYLYLYSHQIKFKALFKGDHRLISNYFDVNKATAYRWIKEGKPTNKIALRLLDIAASGWLPCNDEWNGYLIINGRMITPKGYDIHPAEIEPMCEAFGRLPTANKLIDKPRNHKPYRDREPIFVKALKS